VQKIKTRYILTLIVIVLIIISKPALLVSVKTFLFETIALPSRFVTAVRTSLQSKSACLRENTLLKERAALLALELSKRDQIDKENKRLKALLGFKETLQFKSIACKVIGRSQSGWSKSIIINKGSRAGIKNHMAVSTPKGLVGSVIEVGPFTSKVMLITDPNSRVGIILEANRQAAILVGERGDRCKVIYLSMDVEIKKGERVLTSGYGGLFPEGLIVGNIEDSGIDKIGFFRYAFVDCDQDMNSIEEVLCIK